jgi:magnesium chelatase family protein
MPRMRPEEIVTLDRPESSDTVGRRILQAWGCALERNGGIPNARLRGQRLLHACALTGPGRRASEDLARQLELTARGVHRMLRVARTIADLGGRVSVGPEHLAAAAALNDRFFEHGVAA